MKILLFFFLLSFNSFASYSEMFGAGAHNASLGNQSTNSPSDPSNNYYLPAILAFQKKSQFNYSLSYFDPGPRKFPEMVVKNDTNDDSGTPVYGTPNNDYESLFFNSFHFTIPLEKLTGTLGLSVSMPFGKLLDSSTGNPYLPEYVMYRSRHRRTTIFLNYAKSMSERLALSVGGHLGLQISSDAYTESSLNGNSYGSGAYARATVKPTLGGLFSIAYRFDQALLGFSYQQEMKSHIKARIQGQTSVPPLPFDVDLNSLFYFDPHLFRLNYSYRWNSFEILSTLEYQLWENYETPLFHLSQNSGILQSSDDYESIQPRNILIPKLGFQYQATDTLSFSCGAAYRPTPLQGDFSGPGNSVDTDSTIFGVGLAYQQSFGEHLLELKPSFQYHQLSSKKVTKTENQENGTPGPKLGSPGYSLGGHIGVIALDLEMTL